MEGWRFVVSGLWQRDPLLSSWHASPHMALTANVWRGKGLDLRDPKPWDLGTRALLRKHLWPSDRLISSCMIRCS